MKELRNRQNKIIQLRTSHSRPAAKVKGASKMPEFYHPDLPGSAQSGGIYALVTDMLTATKLTQAAKLYHLSIHNFDRPEPLVEHVRQKKPCLILLDFDSREKESYELLKTFRFDADLKSVPVIGFVSQGKRNVLAEAQEAGCLRVYLKTEFFRELNDLMMRFAK